MKIHPPPQPLEIIIVLRVFRHILNIYKNISPPQIVVATVDFKCQLKDSPDTFSKVQCSDKKLFLFSFNFWKNCRPDIITLGPISQVGQVVCLLVRCSCLYLESHGSHNR